MLEGGAAADLLFGMDGDDRLTGSDGNDTLIGGEGHDIVSGGAGNDSLSGGRGRDRLRGDAGNDRYFIDGADEINKAQADAGIDTVKTGASYTLGNNQENLILTGLGDINGAGNAGANTLTGNPHDNRLDGGAGDDRLDGGFGIDILRGGTGKDVLIYDSDDLEQNGGRGEDTLRFTGQRLTLTPSSLALASGIEVLDIRGSGTNVVIVDAALVTRLSDTDVLRIRADSHDLVTIAANDAWIAGSDIVIAGINYAQYTRDSARLQIEATAMREVGSVLLLGDLNGTNGLRLDGVAAYDLSGSAVSAAGDVNGDGFDGLLIGAPLADTYRSNLRLGASADLSGSFSGAS